MHYDEKLERHHENLHINFDALVHVGAHESGGQARDTEELQETEQVENLLDLRLAIGNEGSERDGRGEINGETAIQVALGDFMCVSFIHSLVRVKVGCSERKNNIDQEGQIDEGVNHRDHFTLDHAWAVTFVEDGHRNGNRVVHGENDDHVGPPLDEGALVTEEDLAVTRRLRWQWIRLLEVLLVVLLKLLVVLLTRLAILEHLRALA